MRSRLLIEHKRIELALDRLDQILDAVETVALDAIIDARWAYARQILTHLDTEDACVYGPLADDARPGVAASAARFEAERNDLARCFRDHARRYWSDAIIDGDRAGYRESLRPKLAAVRDLIAREERLLYPLVEVVPAVAARPARSGRWMADAWRYRAAAPSGR